MGSLKINVRVYGNPICLENKAEEARVRHL